MPRMDGLQATKRFRAFERQHHPEHHLPVVALSANVFDEAINDCTDAGMEGVCAREATLIAFADACVCLCDRLCAQAAAAGHAARSAGVGAEVLNRKGS